MNGNGAGDPGLQPQRTGLAWNRTALAMFVNALLAMKSGMDHHDQLVILMGLLLLAAAGAGMACGALRKRQLAQLRGLAAPPRWLLLATVGATWLAAVAGVLAVAKHF